MIDTAKKQIGLRISGVLIRAIDSYAAREQTNRAKAARSLLEKFFFPYAFLKTVLMKPKDFPKSQNASLIRGYLHEQSLAVMAARSHMLIAECESLEGEVERVFNARRGSGRPNREVPPEPLKVADKTNVLVLRIEPRFETTFQRLSEMAASASKSVSIIASEAMATMAFDEVAVVLRETNRPQAKQAFEHWKEFIDAYKRDLKDVSKLAKQLNQPKTQATTGPVLRHSSMEIEAMRLIERMQSFSQTRSFTIECHEQDTRKEHET